MVLSLQLLVLCVLGVALALWLRHFPYPSPLVRGLLPSRKRWPERQIRDWMRGRQFHPGYLRYFYRDPERRPDAAKGLLAPADGLVTSQDVLEDVRYIVIALSFWDMHIQRSPLDGEVIVVEELGDTHTDGEGRDFAFLREKLCPVQKRIVMQTEIGTVAIRLITSVAARRIETWVAVGESVARGQRIGRILLGSTVVLEVPARYRSGIAQMQQVMAGQTILVPADEESE